MPDKYPQSEGAVFLNDRKQTDKHPDWRGHLHITKDQINQLVKMGRAGQEVKLQIAAWDRESQGGKEYMYIKAEAYMKEEEGGGGDDWGNDNQQQSRGHGRRAQQGTSAHRSEPPQSEPGQDDWEDDDIPF